MLNKCYTCKKSKNLASNGYCRPCNAERMRTRYGPEDRKKWRLRYMYNLSVEEYEEMIRRQAGKCLICGRDEVKLVVDHSHKTGRIRGLLCNPCNHTMGLFHDDSALLAAAAEYLQQYEKEA